MAAISVSLGLIASLPAGSAASTAGPPLPTASADAGGLRIELDGKSVFGERAQLLFDSSHRIEPRIGR